MKKIMILVLSVLVALSLCIGAPAKVNAGTSNSQKHYGVYPKKKNNTKKSYSNNNSTRNSKNSSYSNKKSTTKKSTGKSSSKYSSGKKSSKKSSKVEWPDCDDYEDEDDFLDDWDGNMPDGSDAMDYWDNW